MNPTPSTANDESIARERSRKVGLFGATLWLISLSVLGLAGWTWMNRSQAMNEDTTADHQGPRQSDDPESVNLVHVHAMEAGTFPAPLQMHRFRGEIQNRRQSTLAIRRSGRLTQIHVHAGDSVEAGETLASLDVADLDAQCRIAQAEVAAAQAALDEAIAGPRQETIRAAQAVQQSLKVQRDAARVRLSREQQLARRGAGIAQTLDDVRFEVEQLDASLAAAQARLEELEAGTRQEQVAAARARLAAAEANLESLAVDRRDSLLLAPYAGVISARMLDEGEMVDPTRPILQLQERFPIEATFGIPPGVASQWQIGHRVWISVGHSEQTPPSPRPTPAEATHRDPASGDVWFAAGLVRMTPDVDAITRTRQVEFELAVKPADLLEIPRPIAGQTAILWVSPITVSPEDAFWLPSSSLVRGTRGLWSVYVVDSKNSKQSDVGRIERRSVRVLTTAGQQSQVQGMVTVGEKVVVEGVQRVGPGVAVRMKPSLSDAEKRK